jgi:hypothetical protein
MFVILGARIQVQPAPLGAPDRRRGMPSQRTRVPRIPSFLSSVSWGVCLRARHRRFALILFASPGRSVVADDAISLGRRAV